MHFSGFNTTTQCQTMFTQNYKWVQKWKEKKILHTSFTHLVGNDFTMPIYIYVGTNKLIIQGFFL
jgi:hypothetical protein